MGIRDIWQNYAHRKIRAILLGSAGVCKFPGIINLCKFGLANGLAGRYIPATELELIKFRPFHLGYLMWHIITQVNGNDIAAQINVFDPSRGKRWRFIPFLFFALVYPSISSNLVTLATLITWSDSVCTHTCSPLLSKPLLR